MFKFWVNAVSQCQVSVRIFSIKNVFNGSCSNKSQIRHVVPKLDCQLGDCVWPLQSFYPSWYGYANTDIWDRTAEYTWVRSLSLMTFDLSVDNPCRKRYPNWSHNLWITNTNARCKTSSDFPEYMLKVWFMLFSQSSNFLDTNLSRASWRYAVAWCTSQTTLDNF